MNLEYEEIGEWSKILHVKRGMKGVLQFKNSRRISPCYDDTVNTDEKNCDT